MREVLKLSLAVSALAALLWLLFIVVSNTFSRLRGIYYVGVKKKYIQEILAFGGLTKGDIFYDLGSGDGRILIEAVKKFGVKQALGIEVAPWPYLKSKYRIWKEGLKGAITVTQQSMFKGQIKDLDRATVAYLYGFPTVIEKITNKVLIKLAPGTRLILISFPIKNNKNFRLIKSQKIGIYTSYLFERM